MFKICPDGATGVDGVVLEDTKESGASNIHTSAHSRKIEVDLPPKSPKKIFMKKLSFYTPLHNIVKQLATIKC